MIIISFAIAQGFTLFLAHRAISAAIVQLLDTKGLKHIGKGRSSVSLLSESPITPLKGQCRATALSYLAFSVRKVRLHSGKDMSFLFRCAKDQTFRI